jgi:hypothetical protein
MCRRKYGATEPGGKGGRRTALAAPRPSAADEVGFDLRSRPLAPNFVIRSPALTGTCCPLVLGAYRQGRAPRRCPGRKPANSRAVLPRAGLTPALVDDALRRMDGRQVEVIHERRVRSLDDVFGQGLGVWVTGLQRTSKGGA